MRKVLGALAAGVLVATTMMVSNAHAAGSEFTLTIGTTPVAGCAISVVRLPGTLPVSTPGDGNCQVTLSTGLTYPNETFVGWALAGPTPTPLVSGATVANASEVTSVWSPVQASTFPLSQLAAPPSVQLNRISCPTVTWCLLVGTSLQKNDLGGGNSFVELDKDGHVGPTTNVSFAAARKQSSPDVLVSQLECPAVGVCEGAGLYRAPGAGLLAFILRRSASGRLSERPVSFPASVKGPNSESINGVSCDAVGRCIAVGSVSDAQGHDHGFYVLSSDTNQSVATLLSIPASRESKSHQESLVGVSCDPTGATCVALGAYYTPTSRVQTLAIVFSKMKPGATGLLATTTSFVPASVSCPTSVGCLVTGLTAKGATTLPASIQWSRGAWSQPTPVPFTPGTLNARHRVAVVTATSCVNATECVVGGSFVDARNYVEGFTATWSDGVWSNAVPLALTVNGSTSPISPGHRVEVNSLACDSVGCALVGTMTDAKGDNIAIESSTTGATPLAWWDATVVPSLPGLLLGGPTSALTGVSCAGSSPRCEAVGSTGPGTNGGWGIAVSVHVGAH